MNPKDWHFETYKEFEYARTQFQMTVIYRGQKFSASHLVADEKLYYMTPYQQSDYLEIIKGMLRSQLEKAMFAYDKESAPEPVVTTFITAEMEKKWLVPQEQLYAELSKYYKEAKAKQFDDAVAFTKPSYHLSSPAVGYVKPRDVYRENATSEFEGVEDLDPTLWNEDGEFDGLI